MPTVQIWLTGVTIISNTIQVYRNPVNNTNHGSFITTVTKDCLITNRPCEITIPDGTTKIRLLDFQSYCYWDIPVCDNNICANCSIGFANVINNQIGKLYVGNITSTCDASVDNYVVDWYGPNDPNLLKFTAGKGSLYSNEWTNEFPLTGATSPLLPPGNYVAKIRKIELNGVEFSRTPTPGFVSAEDLINCTLTQTVNGLTCSNGTTPLSSTNPYFTHVFSYTAQSPGVIPQGVETNFILNSGQQYLIYEFEGKVQPDTFEVKLMRNPPITLESIKVGSSGTFNQFTPTITPKERNYTWFRKIISLSQFNIQANEYVNLKVTPNPVANVTTDWSLKIGCFNSFNITKTCLDSYKNSPYKIQKSSIGTPQTSNCSIFIYFYVYGCSKSDNLPFRNSEFGRFITGTTFPSYLFITEPSDNSNLMQVAANFSRSSANLVYSQNTGTKTCTQLTPSQTVRIIKYANPQYKVRLEFNNSTTRDAYYQAALNARTTARSGGSYTYSATDNTQVGYYKFIYFNYISSGINFTCNQENLGYSTGTIHASCDITSGLTSGVHWMEITTPQVSISTAACANPGSYTCYECYLQYSPYNTTNTFRDLTFDYSYPLGIIVPSSGMFGIAYPTYQTYNITLPSASEWFEGKVSGTNTSSYISGALPFLTYSFRTYPFDSSNNPLTAFNNSVFNISDYFEVDDFRFQQTLYSYRVVLTSETPVIFRIEAKQISNFASTGNPIIIYDSSTPNAPINPTYMY